jgi:hypothetical protein
MAMLKAHKPVVSLQTNNNIAAGNAPKWRNK